MLLFVKVDVRIVGYHLMCQWFMIQKALYQAAFQKMRLYYFRDVFHCHTGIKSSLRIDYYQRAIFAKAMAAGFYNHYLISQSLVLNLFLKSQFHFFRPCRFAASTRTDKDVRSNMLHVVFLPL
ncbi:hypothetical protein SDC9_202829 [bioreactor metagenome]|uniref:Uncharacterized protein n=1 Tax=bioreactor metagenome TaxID=1076179 RepID=A0A645IW97_9ZZZZ